MAEYQRVEFPLVGGVDQHTDSRKVSPAQVLRAENTRIAKIGRYDQRYGLTSVTSTVMTGSALSSSGVRLAARGSELLLAESARLLARASEKDRLVSLDALPEMYAQTFSIVQSGSAVLDPDIAAVSSSARYTCTVYLATKQAPGPVVAVIKDATTGTPLLVSQLASSGYAPRVIACGTVFIATWHDGAGTISGQRVDTSAAGVPTWSGAVTLRSDARASAFLAYDIATGKTSSVWVLAYQTNAASPNTTVKLYAFDTTSSLTSVGNGTTGEAETVNFTSCAVVYASNLDVYVVAWTLRNGVPNDIARSTYHSSTTYAVSVAKFQVASQASTTVLGFDRVTCAPYQSANVQFAWCARALTATGSRLDDFVWSEEFNGSGTSLSVSKKLYGASLASKLLAANGTTYALVNVNLAGCHTNAASAGQVLDHNVVLCEIADGVSSSVGGRPVCTIAPRFGSGEINGLGHIPSIVADPVVANSYLSVFGVLSVALEPTSTTTAEFFRLLGVRVTLDSSSRQSCELGALTYTTGGLPAWYDGLRVGEVGFLAQPHVTIVPSVGAGTLTASSTYQYAIVECQCDSAGNVHRGIPYKASVAMGVGQNTNTLVIPYLGCTVRQDGANNFGPPTFEIYRTVHDGTAFRLLTELQANSQSAATFLYVDTIGDAGLANQRYLYDTATADGRAQLAHVNPPSATLCMTHRDRVWFAGCPDRKEIWVSSKYVQGEAPFFSEAFRIIVDDGGDITALASMDDKAIVFKSDRIFFVTGDGPDDSGLNSDWSAATKINGTVGCVEPRSVVVTPMGIVFQSSVSLSLLGRDLQVDARWGRPVEDSLAGATIVSATLHKTLTEVRFLLSSGVELRYDYAAQAWMTAVLTPGSASAWVGSTLYYLGGSSLYREDSTTYLDAGSFVGMTLEFAPLALGGRLGEQYVSDVLLLCDRYTDHELKLETSTDGGSYAAETPKQWTAAELSALGTEYVLNYKPLRASRSRLAKVRLSSLTPSSGTVGTGRGFSIAGLTFKAADTGDKYQLMGTSQKG